MGYVRNPLRRLAFADPQFAGWDIDTRVPDVRTWMRVADLTNDRRLSFDNPACADDVDELVGIVAGHLADWNLEDEQGAPVPLSAEAIHPGLDKDAVKALIEAWIDTLVGVPAPLPQPSADGSPADEIPMTPLNQAS